LAPTFSSQCSITYSTDTAIYTHNTHEQLHRAFREHLSTYVDTSTYGEAFKKKKQQPPTATDTNAAATSTTANPADTGAATAATVATASADSTNDVAADATHSRSTDVATADVIEPDASQIVISVTPLKQRKRAQQTSNSLSKYGPASQQQQASIYRNNRKEPWPIDRPEYCKFAIHKVCVCDYVYIYIYD
jgi:hypothetical protein